MTVSIDQFLFSLPAELIAQTPAQPRDSSRLLQVNRQTGELNEHIFHQLPTLLQPTDVLIRNNTKVLPARLYGQKPTGGHCEILLIKQTELLANSCRWECMTKPGLKLGQQLSFPDSVLIATCLEVTGFTRTLEFNMTLQDFYVEVNRIGHVPIPPYIEWHNEDETELRQLYQTTYAKITGSAAAPTAGLHFTPELDQQLRDKGIQIEEVTLHVGLGTFLPLQKEQLASGTLHHEVYQVTTETATRINQAKQADKRLIAVGTTTTRVLETAAQLNPTTGQWELAPSSGETDLMIQPGYQFKLVNAMITNFHLPKSSLLMLISAFSTEPNTPLPFITFTETTVGQAYLHAIAQKYRFYSFGDAMLIE